MAHFIFAPIFSYQVFITRTYVTELNSVFNAAQKNILKKTYLINFETENWNYYDNIEHITNNVSETFNKYLKKLFAKNQLFFNYYQNCKKEESKYYIDYERRTAGILRNKKQKKKN
ncbi:hypothetical protein H8356DRAFT_1431274 [Neocallimastix lanati (nom. inval.)]|nr:hypothetical protein H8356DRAFT_1431274 [Neocallimastix sp. JGI-2020a]